MSTYNEKSSGVFDLSFLNAARRLQAPLSITYRIDDMESGQQIRPWTSLAPAAQQTVVLTASDNRLLGSGDQERRMITVVASYSVDEEDQVTKPFIYTVQRVKFLNL